MTQSAWGIPLSNLTKAERQRRLPAKIIDNKPNGLALTTVDKQARHDTCIGSHIHTHSKSPSSAPSPMHTHTQIHSDFNKSSPHLLYRLTTMYAIYFCHLQMFSVLFVEESWRKLLILSFTDSWIVAQELMLFHVR